MLFRSSTVSTPPPLRSISSCGPYVAVLETAADCTDTRYIKRIALSTNVRADQPLTADLEDDRVSVRQARPILREYIGTENGLAFSVAHPQIDDGCATFALHHTTVLILKDRNPNRSALFKYGRSDGMGSARRLDKSQPSCTAIFWIRFPMQSSI